MNEKDEWLNRQLDAVLHDVHEKNEADIVKELHQSISSTITFAQMLTKERLDLSVALFITSAGYTLHRLITTNYEIEIDRTKTDEEIKNITLNLTLADLESLFSQLGVAMWKMLWRPTQ